MSRIVSVALVALLSALGALAQAPNARVGPNKIISPWTYWPATPQAGRFYNPYGIVIGGNLFLYVQGGVYNSANGGPGSECPVSGEQILVFSAPYTFSGIRNPFTYRNIASPCYGVNHHYQVGSVFQSAWDGKYKLLVDETDVGTSIAAGNFKRTLLLTSSDGLSWSRQVNLHDGNTPPLIAQSVIGGLTVSVLEVALTQGASNWWGTFSFGTNVSGCDCALGRMKVVQDAANVRGFVVSIFGTDDQWHAVNDDGTFTFMPKDTNNATTPMKKVVLINHAGHWEAWGNTFSQAQALDPMDPGCDDGSPYRDSIVMATISEATTVLGTPVYMTSSLNTNLDPKLNWPVATRNDLGRQYPWRFDDSWGKSIIYSGSTDRYCWANGTNVGYRGTEILLTVLDSY